MEKLFTLKISLSRYLADLLKTQIICKEEDPTYSLPKETSVPSRMNYDTISDLIKIFKLT